MYFWDHPAIQVVPIKGKGPNLETTGLTQHLVRDHLVCEAKILDPLRNELKNT